MNLLKLSNVKVWFLIHFCEPRENLDWYLFVAAVCPVRIVEIF
jgi:hypothetical protein